MDPAKPSLELLRSLTDEHVLRALMRHRRLTRAELAAETGISKPTAGESVRRLTEAGLVADTHERTPGGRGKGRVGSYYALSGDIGAALAISIAPEGIVAERIDAYGDTVARAEVALDRPARPEQVAAALRTATVRVSAMQVAPSRTAATQTAAPRAGAGPAVSSQAAPRAGAGPAVSSQAAAPRAGAAQTAAPQADAVPAVSSQAATAQAAAAQATTPRAGVVPAASSQVTSRAAAQATARAAAVPRAANARGRHGSGPAPRLAVVSAADPVDRATGRLIQLPDAPFLLGELDPVEILAPHVAGPVTVDNDVNWAALAEHGGALRDFGYVYLGEGLGCAIISDGEVRRGHGGLAGEIAHLVTTGPHGRAIRFIEVFADLGLRRPGSTAIDVPRLLAAATGPHPEAAAIRTALADAVSGVLAAVVALADPETVVIGGPWGTHPAILDAITAASARLPRHVPVRAAKLTAEPSLAGARIAALQRLRTAIIEAAR